MEDNNILNNNNMVYISDKDIKKEFDIQVKTENDSEEVNEFINEEIIVKTEIEKLYKDHTIKEEIVIGPEIIQETKITDVIKNETGSLSKNKFSCKTCHTSFLNKEMFQNHVYKCEITCTDCKKIFNTRDELKEHIEACTCKVCNKHFSFASNLLRHVNMHMGNTKHKCTECNESFVRKDYLKVHIQRHHSLDKNIRQISSRIPTVCKLCKKEYASRYSCNYHIKYTCPKNENKIERKQSKWYKCDLCDTGYPYRSSLSAHITKRHMGIKPNILHECDYCGRTYVKKHNLQCHIQWKHMYVKPYSCKCCGQTFPWQCALANHKKKVHGKVKPKKEKYL